MKVFSFWLSPSFELCLIFEVWIFEVKVFALFLSILGGKGLSLFFFFCVDFFEIKVLFFCLACLICFVLVDQFDDFHFYCLLRVIRSWSLIVHVYNYSTVFEINLKIGFGNNYLENKFVLLEFLLHSSFCV